MKALVLFGLTLLFAGSIALTWFLTKKRCGSCPTPEPCPECPTCPTPDPCPTCPVVDCSKDCPYKAPSTLVVDMTTTPPTAEFLGIAMEYTGQAQNQGIADKSAIFSYQGLPDVEVFLAYGGGTMYIAQVNAYYSPDKPVIFGAGNVTSPGVFTSSKVLPVSVKI